MNYIELLQKTCSDQAKKIQELESIKERLDLSIKEVTTRVINETNEQKRFVWKMILDSLNMVKGELIS